MATDNSNNNNKPGRPVFNTNQRRPTFRTTPSSNNSFAGNTNTNSGNSPSNRSEENWNRAPGANARTPPLNFGATGGTQRLNAFPSRPPLSGAPPRMAHGSKGEDLAKSRERGEPAMLGMGGEGVGLNQEQEQYEALYESKTYDQPMDSRDFEGSSAFSVPASFYDADPFRNPFTSTVTDPGKDSAEVVYMGRHTNVTRGGRVFSFSAMVIDGDGNGTAGYGYGRGDTVSSAVRQATKVCSNNQVTINRFNNTSLVESIRAQYKRSIVKLFPFPNDGVPKKSSKLMRQIMEMYGITNTTGKFIGNNNRKHMVKVLFKAIQAAEHPDFSARKRGVKYYNPLAAWKRGDPSPATDFMKATATRHERRDL